MVSMKATWILLFLAWNVRSEFVCPRSRGYFPDPVCCNRYYVCMNNQSNLETCPDQMMFDIRKRNCFTRSKVNCGDRIPCNEIEKPTYNITEGTAYNTTEGTACNTTEETGYNTTARPAYNITDNTIIEYKTSYISENTTLEDASFTKIPSDFNVTTREQENASMNEFDILTSEYVKIDNTTSSVPDINYTVITITADDKSTHTTESANHQSDSTTKETTTFDYYYSYEDFLTCPEAYGLFPHPTEKNKYMHCQNWFPHVLSCPADLLFDKDKKVCAWIQRKN